MQLPPTDAVVLVSGLSPIRAKKARYLADPQLARRVLPPPTARAQPVPSEPKARRLVPSLAVCPPAQSN